MADDVADRTTEWRISARLHELERVQPGMTSLHDHDQESHKPQEQGTRPPRQTATPSCHGMPHGRHLRLSPQKQAKPGSQGIVRPAAVERRLRRRINRHPLRQEVDEACVEAQRVVSLPLISRGKEHF